MISIEYCELSWLETKLVSGQTKWWTIIENDGQTGIVLNVWVG